MRQATALAWIGSYAVELKHALFQEFYRENRLLADTVRAQIASGRAQPADAVTPKQEAAQLEEQQDQFDTPASPGTRPPSNAGSVPPPMSNPSATGRNGPSIPRVTPTNLQHHPELVAFAPMTRQAQAKVREAEAEKQSDWSWELDYQKRGREFGDMVSVQFTFDLPLFPETRQNPKIAAKRAELNQLEAEREALAREHTQQLEDQLADYQRLERAVRRTQESLLPLAKEKAELTLASYRAGKSDVSAVVATRRELIEARLKQIDINEQKALTSARLYFAYGETGQ